MVPELAKKSRDRRNQWLKPGSYDEKMASTISQDIGIDKDDFHNKFDNFSVQKDIKKNTRAPLREEEWNEILSELHEEELHYIYNIIESSLSDSMNRGADAAERAIHTPVETHIARAVGSGVGAASHGVKKLVSKIRNKRR